MRWAPLLLIAAAGCGHTSVEPERAPTPPDSIEGKVKEAVGAKDSESIPDGKIRVIRRQFDGIETDELIDADPEALERLGMPLPKAITDASMKDAMSIEDNTGELWTTTLEFESGADSKAVQDAYVQVLAVKDVQTKDRMLTITGSTEIGEEVKVEHETGLAGSPSRIKITKSVKPGE